MVYILMVYYLLFILNFFKMESRTVESQKGKPKLYHNGYVYNENDHKNNTKYYRCEQYHKKSSGFKCMGRLIQKGDNKIIKGEHNHAGDGNLIKKHDFLYELKARAKNGNDIPSEIIGGSLSNIDDYAANILPKTSNMKRIIRFTKYITYIGIKEIKN